MTNPGVIKLLSDEENVKICINQHFEVEDRIGETIHISCQNINVDLSIDEFDELTKKLHSILDTMINVEGFRSCDYDPMFLFSIPYFLLNLKKVEKDNIEIMNPHLWSDPENSIDNADTFKTLNGYTDDDEKSIRINRLGKNIKRISNIRRTESMLDSIKKNGYDGNKKIVVSQDNIIIDGNHRASCLLYLYGNITVPVLKMFFSHSFDDNKTAEKEIDNLFGFCRSHKEIYLYGAGEWAVKYHDFLSKNGIYINGFITTHRSEKSELFSKPVYDALDFSNNHLKDSQGIIIAFNTTDPVPVTECTYWHNTDFFLPKHHYVFLGMKLRDKEENQL